MKYILWFKEISSHDLNLVGGKNSALGEMVSSLATEGIAVPDGFAVTVAGFSRFLEFNHLSLRIEEELKKLKTGNTQLLSHAGKTIRELMYLAEMPGDLKDEIVEAYRLLGAKSVAVRSSATAEDLPEASFAGLQETFLNVESEEDLITYCRKCFASLYTDRAISYRITNHIDHSSVRLSVGVQQMIRSDLASSGVMFTLDTESGARNVILINSAFGLGENIVGGKIEPDEFIVLKDLINSTHVPILRRKTGSKKFKLVYSQKGQTENRPVPESLQSQLSLSDNDVMTLAKWGCIIENHFSSIKGSPTPMDIEWGKDGETGKLYILQARPETVFSKRESAVSKYVLEQKSKSLLKGRAVGNKIGFGAVKIINSIKDFSAFKEGEVLVAEMTNPDWEPVMEKASAVITNSGGRTCHAAIISRELGVPCIVGTVNATEVLANGKEVTVSCAEGDEGIVYEGKLDYREERLDWSTLKRTRTKVMVNLVNPGHALSTSILPVDGIGLVRMEFIISEHIKIHPMALVHYNLIQDDIIRSKISALLGPYQQNPTQYFIDRLSDGLGLIAGAFYPRPVIVRFSDFKSNEYGNLIGGNLFESFEENPMLGFRGASRYYSESYREGFSLECEVIKKLREQAGLNNIKVMIPFCRSPEEGIKVLNEIHKNGLRTGSGELEVYVMSEIPSNVLRAGEFAKIFDGFSIGSNDLTQMILAVDRDSAKISELFNERDPAVMTMIGRAIEEAKRSGKPIGICGQARVIILNFPNFWLA